MLPLLWVLRLRLAMGCRGAATRPSAHFHAAILLLCRLLLSTPRPDAVYGHWQSMAPYICGACERMQLVLAARPCEDVSCALAFYKPKAGTIKHIN